MSVQESPIFISVPAGSDLSTKQYRFMDVVSGKLSLAGSGTRVAGVLSDDPAATDRPGQLQISGRAKVVAGGTISAGGGVASDANGEAVAASGSAFVVGIALTAAADNDIMEVLLTPSGAVGIAAASETITSGAANTGVDTTYLSVTGTQAYTLADGTYVGQKKNIECTVAASTPIGTLTINDVDGGPLTHVFNAVGQRLELEWRTGGWHTNRKVRAGVEIVVIGTTEMAGHDMHAVLSTSVTGTVSSTGTKSVPDGTVPGELLIVACSTAASTPIGNINFTGLTLANAAVTDLQAIGATTDTVTLEWTGAKWLVIANSGITVA